MTGFVASSDVAQPAGAASDAEQRRPAPQRQRHAASGRAERGNGGDMRKLWYVSAAPASTAVAPRFMHDFRQLFLQRRAALTVVSARAVRVERPRVARAGGARPSRRAPTDAGSRANLGARVVTARCARAASRDGRSRGEPAARRGTQALRVSPRRGRRPGDADVAHARRALGRAPARRASTSTSSRGRRTRSRSSRASGGPRRA